MKNIAFIISNLGPGGAEKVAVTIAKYLAKKNYNIYIYHLCDDDVYFNLYEKNITLVNLNLCKFFKNPLKRIKNKFRQLLILTNKLREDRIELIFSFITDTNLLSIMTAKLLKLPIIACEHSIFDVNEKRWIIKIARRFLYPLSDYITVLTKEDAKNYYKFIKREKLVIISNPLLLKIDSYKPILERDKIILAVGRLNKLKGFDKLIKAFSMIKNRNGYKLVIVGGEANVNKLDLQKVVKDLKMDEDVILTGFRRDVEKFYINSRIFVLSSEYEAYPNVLIEALGYGCACISFDCPYGPREIIKNGENGILVKNQDVVELSNKIEELINDEEVQRTLSLNGLKIKKKLEFEHIMYKWEELIENVKN